MNLYYIVKEYKQDIKPMWCAYKQGILSAFGIYNWVNAVCDTYSCESADQCEAKLKRSLNPIKPEVVRVTRL